MNKSIEPGASAYSIPVANDGAISPKEIVRRAAEIPVGHQDRNQSNQQIYRRVKPAHDAEGYLGQKGGEGYSARYADQYDENNNTISKSPASEWNAEVQRKKDAKLQNTGE